MIDVEKGVDRYPAFTISFDRKLFASLAKYWDMLYPLNTKM